MRHRHGGSKGLIACHKRSLSDYWGGAKFSGCWDFAEIPRQVARNRLRLLPTQLPAAHICIRTGRFVQLHDSIAVMLPSTSSQGKTMRSLRRSILALIFCAFAGLVSTAASSVAQAPDWPQRAVKFVIPLGPGSGVDITARVFADRLSQKWGQQVVVENRPGGDAFVAITAVIGAHDDHVLLFAPASTFTAHPLLHEKLPYDIKDLVPIARVTNTLIALGVPTALEAGSVKELAAKIKAAPGKLNYASVTGANDLMWAAFLKTENLEMAKVPYKDPVTAINDLSEGRIQAFVGAYAIMRPRVLAGKVKVIALTNLQHA